MNENIPAKLLKPYDPNETEGRIYEKWLSKGFFNPDMCVKEKVTKANAEAFSIVLPPPNVTGTLHMGSAFMLALEDIIVRYKRMRGFKTLWLPGTDHAAIATQSKVEKILEKEGTRRSELGREKFLERVDAFAKDSHDHIVDQVKKIGCSIDWSREAFTLDEKRSLAVRTAFKQMYDDGIIYRGYKIVNWDPKGQTVISDDEIVYKEEKTTFYYFKYGPFTIGTARPETKFGDKYVVMHPDDKRYAKYTHGETLELEWINGPIKATIIKDDAIDMEFGTGVMTITPWHSMIDFEIATRHKLDKEQVIDRYGKLLPITGEFAGKKIKEARSLIVEKLRAKGLVVKEEAYTHNVATAERTDGLIEPQIMNQWFVNVNKEFPYPHDTLKDVPKGTPITLKKLMQTVVNNGEIGIIPDRFSKVYFHWIDNLRDWCISRQIWYGHRIPVWYKTTGGTEELYCGTEAPTGAGWVQDEDTLDTWFSSGLWTFSTLGWPEKTTDLKTFHPTSLLETGYDILFFWVARMILMSTYLVGEVPFKTVYLHGIVRDKSGQKISKSLGNNIDPVDMIKKYGADAVRMSLIIGTGPGNDSKMSEDKIRAYKLFANKLWNATRFVLSSIEGETAVAKPELTMSDREKMAALEVFTKEVTEDMEAYRLHLAGEKLYHYFWHTFADIIIEEAKPRLLSAEAASTIWMLRAHLEILLTLLHPFMPFVTEELWSLIRSEEGSLMVRTWPS
jgi:valyl-tRNA synthetase